MKISRILARRYLPLTDFDEAVTFHEDLLGQKASSRFEYDEYGLKIAAVSSILFVGGTAQSLKPFEGTHMTFLIDDIEAYARYLPRIGATITEAVKPVPTGWNMTVRHPDGTLVEYVQHKVQARGKNPD